MFFYCKTQLGNEISFQIMEFLGFPFFPDIFPSLDIFEDLSTKFYSWKKEHFRKNFVKKCRETQPRNTKSQTLGTVSQVFLIH